MPCGKCRTEVSPLIARDLSATPRLSFSIIQLQVFCMQQGWNLELFCFVCSPGGGGRIKEKISFEMIVVYQSIIINMHVFRLT